MQYGYLYSHEFAYLAAHGYVVYWSNPRGGQGYGEEHAKSIFGQWGSVDYDDVMAWADYMAAQPYIDTERMGVTGGSYGGYMTTLIIGRSDRFKAAVAQRVVSNFTSFYGSSDLSWGLENLAGTPAPWDDIDHAWSQSPISLHRQRHHADAGHPQRNGPALRPGAGRAGVRRPAAARHRYGVAPAARRVARLVARRPYG